MGSSDPQPDADTAQEDDESTDNRATERKSADPEDRPTISRRVTLASLVSIGGLGLLSSPVQANHDGAHWKRDVDADGNNLFDLGAVAMRDNSTEITDFAGENLLIDNNGKLHATGVSRWEDPNEDGLLEPPDHTGIDVENTTTEQVTVGDGEAVTGVWGDRGELVPLLAVHARHSASPTTETSYQDLDDMSGTRVIPFGSLSFTNISQLHVSISGVSTGEDGATSFARITDQTNNAPISDSEVQVTNDGSYVPFDGPKAAYDPGKPIRVDIQVKTSGGEIDIRDLTFHVWGEIS